MLKEIGYDIEEYWSKVANNITNRKDYADIAGDDDPYYIYKRQKYLDLLLSIDFNNTRLLEVGCGPGGNLKEIINQYTPQTVAGVDISQNMIDIARNNLPSTIGLEKIDGKNLPFEKDSLDIVFCATVLQHVTYDDVLLPLVKDMCRVSEKKIYLFERTEKKWKGTTLNHGRTVEQYKKLFESNGFGLDNVVFLKTEFSYYTCGILRKTFRSKDHFEGKQTSRISQYSQKLVLPVSKIIDEVFPTGRGLTLMEFTKH